MRKQTIAGLYLLLFVIHVLSGLIVATRAEFPTTVDELAHYSYVADMQEQRSLRPRYETMRLVDPRDGSRLEQANYLGHPPIYYLLLSILPLEITWMRAANVVISSLAVGLLCLAGYRYLKDPMQHVVFASAVALCPKAQLLSGMINNDNLALLGGALVLIGLLRTRSPSSALLIGLGFALGALSKLTAGLILGLLIGVVHLRELRSLPWRYVAIAAAFVVIGVSPYVVNVVEYGSPIYVERTEVFVPEGERMDLGVLGFVARFFQRLPTTWPALEPGNLLNIVPFGILLGLAVVAHDRIGRGGALVLAAFMVIHIAYMYLLFLRTGYPYGAFFRYYLPLWPVIAWGAASGLLKLPERAHPVTAVALMLLMLYGSVPLNRNAFVHI